MIETATTKPKEISQENILATLADVGKRAQDLVSQGADSEDIVFGLRRAGVFLNIPELTSVARPVEMLSWILRVVDQVNGYSCKIPTGSVDPDRRIIICAGGSINGQ